ncbi:MAG TPA: 1-deoxy-D-xylulose-5-phosphate reductoisomerase [Candidatus Kapabacteria bacterium]
MTHDSPIPPQTIAPRTIALFGSTGSIGTNTLDVVRHNPERFRIVALAANRNVALLRKQVEEFQPRFVALADPSAAKELRDVDCELFCGPEGLQALAQRGEYDIFVGGLVGFAGLSSTVEAVKLGKRVALANKETLVVAGEWIMALARRTGAEIVPIDSEHSAIYQCLVGETKESIRRIVLTASGGPFRTLPKEQFPTVTPAMALKHPKWVMGRKITIDSATLMNKGLEILEAKWLFDLELSKIDVIVHPQSIVHSFVEFSDGSMKAQLGMPDMRLAIQYALTAPERLNTSYHLLDLASATPLEFFEPDYDKFPTLSLARLAGERGGLYPCVLNAANEVAVEAFLEGMIPFPRIPELIHRALESNAYEDAQANDLRPILHCDADTRAQVHAWL